MELSSSPPRRPLTERRANWPEVARIGLVIIVAWLVYPVLTPAHVEGFSASIESLAIHLATGTLADYDRLHPANLEFFALSRLGTVTFVAALIRWLGLGSEWECARRCG